MSCSHLSGARAPERPSRARNKHAIPTASIRYMDGSTRDVWKPCKVEKAGGFHLLGPWRRVLRTTPKKQEMIDEARRLLQLRDAQQREGDLTSRTVSRWVS